MNQVLKALCFAGVGASLMMCNVEAPSDESLLLEAAQPVETAACMPQSVQLISGINDTFAAGAAEPTNPRADVLTWLSSLSYPGLPGSRGYDQAYFDQYFAHSWTFTPPTSQHYLTGATLTGRLQCRDTNESLYIGFIHPVTGLSPEPSWGGNLAAPPISANCTHWIALPFTYNLASLPGTGQNLVPKMKTKGYLDVVMQDDSLMDYLTLRLDWACQVKEGPELPELP